MNASRRLATILAIAVLTYMAGAVSPALAQGHGGGGGHGGSSAGGGGHGGSSAGGGGHATSYGGHGAYSGGHSSAYGSAGAHGGFSAATHAHFTSGGFHGGFSGPHFGGTFNGGTFFRGNFFHGGYFFRGGCCFGPRFGFGFFLPVLPAFYATYWWGGIPYYYANDVYFTWNPNYSGYVATDPPPGPADNDSQPPPAAGSPEPASGAPASGAPASGQTYEYPNNGQTEEQQANDRYQCHQWAVSQSGYDPTANGSATTGQGNYHRALTACMQGRGYSVR